MGIRVTSIPRGYCGIGVFGSKTVVNVGTLWRSAAIMGAHFIFTVGRRWPNQASDTIKAWKHIPLFEYATDEEFWANIPFDCVPVAIEIDARARPLARYTHPARAIYLLGAEDNGIPPRVLERCRDIIQLPGEFCLNVAVAGSIVLYDIGAPNMRWDKGFTVRDLLVLIQDTGHTTLTLDEVFAHGTLQDCGFRDGLYTRLVFEPVLGELEDWRILEEALDWLREATYALPGEPGEPESYEAQEIRKAKEALIRLRLLSPET